MNRACGIAAGILNHLGFAVTVYFLFGFLAGWTGPSEPVSGGAIGCDVLLCLQFAISHSWLLLPSTREGIAKYLPKPFYGLLFCAATCFSLLLTIACWRPIDVVLFEFSGWPRDVVQVAFYLTWPTLLYSISLTGLGYQTGFTPWWYWLRGRAQPRRDFVPTSLYHLLRHPIYLSFLGLLWFTPRFTLDRAILVGIWSVYIFIGSVLKDRRLEHYLGDSYRNYETQVAGYPGMFWGPLARRRLPQVGTSLNLSVGSSTKLEPTHSASDRSKAA